MKVKKYYLSFNGTLKPLIENILTCKQEITTREMAFDHNRLLTDIVSGSCTRMLHYPTK